MIKKYGIFSRLTRSEGRDPMSLPLVTSTCGASRDVSSTHLLAHLASMKSQKVHHAALQWSTSAPPADLSHSAQQGQFFRIIFRLYNILSGRTRPVVSLCDLPTVPRCNGGRQLLSDSIVGYWSFSSVYKNQFNQRPLERSRNQKPCVTPRTPEDDPSFCRSHAR